MTSTERIVKALRPTALDEVTQPKDEDARIAAIVATPRSAPSRRRARKTSLILTVPAAAAAAAVAIPVVASGGAHAPRPRATATGSPAALDAKSFLLTAAESIASTPEATSGRYWYVRTRMCTNGLSQGTQPQTAKPGYSYTACASEDVWTTKAGFHRIVIGIDPKVTFASPQDEARWRAAGAPALTQKLAWSENDDPAYATKWGVGKTIMSVRQLQALPADPDALRTMIARSATVKLRGAELDAYIWTFAPDLFSQPITASTRAGLYRMLAQIPGVRVVTTTKDSQGHPVVVLGYRRHEPGAPARPAQNGRPAVPAIKPVDIEDDLAFRQDTYAFLSDQFGQGQGSVTNEQLIAEWTNVEGKPQGSRYSD